LYENILKEKAYEEFDLWVSNFALNLKNIWNEFSAGILTNDDSINKKNHAIIIGKGPSINKKNHLKLLANSNYDGTIVCCDGKLIDTLNAGVTPDKFPDFYVVTVDPLRSIMRNYDNPIVQKYGSKINAIFSVVSHPDAVQSARNSKMKIHWIHSLVDYNEGKKSFNYITSVMVRTKNHSNGLPAIQTGANVGTSSWFTAWKILKCSKIALIGINHGWEPDDPWDLILSHTLNNNEIPTEPISIDRNTKLFKKLFPKLFNPDLKSYFILDPIFQLYRSALLEFIERSPDWVSTYNATEGGSIFGKRVYNIKLNDFLCRSENGTLK
tara:strand:+ start:705 stop:1679 length:975 start_codon:yes stop_codon:yes gene_type:complete